MRLDEYSRCRDGARVVLYSVEGGGHSWPGERPAPWRRAGGVSHDIDASAIIIDFFLRRPSGGS